MPALLMPPSAFLIYVKYSTNILAFAVGATKSTTFSSGVVSGFPKASDIAIRGSFFGNLRFFHQDFSSHLSSDGVHDVLQFLSNMTQCYGIVKCATEGFTKVVCVSYGDRE